MGSSAPICDLVARHIHQDVNEVLINIEKVVSAIVTDITVPRRILQKRYDKVHVLCACIMFKFAPSYSELLELN